MSYAFNAVVFIFFWLIWIALTPIVFVAVMAAGVCLWSQPEWKPWIDQFFDPETKHEN